MEATIELTDKGIEFLQKLDKVLPDPWDRYLDGREGKEEFPLVLWEAGLGR